MERYLEGEELGGRGGRARAEGRRHARRDLPGRVRRRDEEPRHDGAARPARRGRALAGEARLADRGRRQRRRGVRLQDHRRSVRRPDHALPRAQRARSRPTRRSRTCARTRRSASASCCCSRARSTRPTDEFGEGDIGAVAKLKETQTGDLLLDDGARRRACRRSTFPEPVMSFAVTPKAKGDEEKAAASLRRLSEEDPTLVLRRDERTGEQLLAGLSQMHVEVAVERLQRRFGVDVELAPAARPVPGDDPHRVARAGPLQEADGRPRAVRRLRDRARAASGPRGLRVRGQDRRRRHPAELPAGRRQGHPGGDAPRRARRRAGAGSDRPARRRPVPQRRLLGDGVQDRRLDGVQGRVPEGRPDAARADHGARGHRSRRGRGRRQRRSQLAARAAARHGAARAA